MYVYTLYEKMTICIYIEEMQTKLCKCIYRYIFMGISEEKYIIP